MSGGYVAELISHNHLKLILKFRHSQMWAKEKLEKWAMLRVKHSLLFGLILHSTDKNRKSFVQSHIWEIVTHSSD